NSLVPTPEGEPAGDFTAPTASHALSQPANDAGWHKADVTVTLGASDNDGGSGVYEIVYAVNGGAATHASGASVNVPVNTEGETTVTYYAKDYAGNVGTPQTVTVKLDKTAPVIGEVTRTQPNANGWNNTDVVAGFNATDALSGFASGTTATGSHTFDAEGAGQSYTFTVEDLAGNTASASVSGVNIDKTAPTVNVAKPSEGAFYLVGQAVAADYACGDNLSGNAACAGTTPDGAQIDTATPGAKTFTVNTADLAGNIAAQTVNYTVGYNLGLLYDPSKLNNAGSTVPVKLQLVDVAGANLSTAEMVVHVLGTSPASSDTYTAAAIAAGSANPNGDFRFDPTLGTGGGYIFNLKTTGFAPGAYKLYFNVGGDPYVYAAQFRVK
ncbi:MAG TPA: hypothetical protein VNZ44_13665, partial [Pyrinomonadaceae bacterium]|nr:hypothetical protein [Pyrinomonadaceae bacterium]